MLWLVTENTSFIGHWNFGWNQARLILYNAAAGVRVYPKLSVVYDRSPICLITFMGDVRMFPRSSSKEASIGVTIVYVGTGRKRARSCTVRVVSIIRDDQPAAMVPLFLCVSKFALESTFGILFRAMI